MLRGLSLPNVKRLPRGERCGKAVASLMTKCTAEGGICSRFGGDEFVADYPDDGQLLPETYKG